MLKTIENLGTVLTRTKQQNIKGGIVPGTEFFLPECTEEDQPGYYENCVNSGRTGGGSGSAGTGDDA